MIALWHDGIGESPHFLCVYVYICKDFRRYFHTTYASRNSLMNHPTSERFSMQGKPYIILYVLLLTSVEATSARKLLLL